MADPIRALLTALLLAAVPVALAGHRSPAPVTLAQEVPEREPAPVPYIEREEVRFVTLDIVAEEKARGWRPLRNLTIAEIEVRVGDRLMAVDQFEDHCLPGSPDSPPGAPATTQSGTPGASPPDNAASESPGPAGSPGGIRYILYFEMEHLNLAGRDAAFKAARSWAADRFSPADEVMIITAGRGLRIVRTLLPAADHLLEDLEAASSDFRATELWGAMESMRQWELGQEKNLSVYRSLAKSYTEIDRSKTRHSLENMRDMMSIFDMVEGTKNLVLFADTIRLIPGRQYGITTNPPIDVHTQLQGLAEAANERNVRIYPVKPGLWAPFGPGDPLADDALTMLASETGGRVFEGSNEVVGMFDRVGEDLACFYRVGFRIRPRYSGKVEPIRVRVLDRSGAVRLRYRQTLEDPTREAIDSDIIRAAFMAPSAASGFPIAVRATEMFRQDGGARLQIEVGTSLGALLGLPVPGRRRGSRQVRVEIGARVVPLRPVENDGGEEGAAEQAADPAASRRGVWADVATDQPSLGFGRQAVLTLPPDPSPDRRFDRVVATEEFDAPPGRYRIVAVIQDQLARTVSAAIADVEVDAVDPDAAPSVGPIGLASGDGHTVVLQNRSVDPDDPDPDEPPWNGKEVAAANALLPQGALLAGTPVIESGNPAHLFYSVCLEPVRRGRQTRRSGASPTVDRKIGRLLTCGPENTTFRLPPRSLPEQTRQDRCVTMLDSIPAADLPEGRCRFEVHLITPDGSTESSVRRFSVVPPSGRDASTIGSLLTAPGGSLTCPV